MGYIEIYFRLYNVYKDLTDLMDCMIKEINRQCLVPSYRYTKKNISTKYIKPREYRKENR